MSVREQAVAALKGLWPDGGAVVLRGAGVATSWEEVLAPLPEDRPGTGVPHPMDGTEEWIPPPTRMDMEDVD